MKQTRNDHGGMFKARKQFLKDLQNDEDFINHRLNATTKGYKKHIEHNAAYYRDEDGILDTRYVTYEDTTYYGTASINEDIYANGKAFTKIVKRYLKGA